MRPNESADEGDEAMSPTSPERRHYAPPRILYREPLEAMAAICSPPGKGNPGFCPSGPISS
jgi:hypothetical protein